MKRLSVLAGALLAALALPVQALADDQYQGGTGTGVGSGGPDTVVGQPVGSLPFTGLELGIIVAVAMGLLLTGILLRLAARQGAAGAK
jgi:hypothetical protein